MNCKPGIVAYVTAGAVTPDLAGRYVTVKRIAINGERFKSINGVITEADLNQIQEVSWVCSANEPIPWLITNGLGVGTVLYHHERPIADRLLRPIDAGESPEESIEAMKKLHEITEKV